MSVAPQRAFAVSRNETPPDQRNAIAFFRVWNEALVNDGGVMAQIGEDKVEVDPGEVVVERKVVPTSSRRFSPLALLIVAAFVVTCVVVFGGYHFGLREPYPLEKAAENMQPVPTPAAPVEGNSAVR